jgi:hypothetical protein
LPHAGIEGQARDPARRIPKMMAYAALLRELARSFPDFARTLLAA